MNTLKNINRIKALWPAAILPECEDVTRLQCDEVLLVTNGDLRESANKACWPVQEKYEKMLTEVLGSTFKKKTVRIGEYKEDKQHGFISSQAEGMKAFEAVDPEAPVIVLLTVWQYSHHIAPALAQHRGPILVLANFDGTWPGLVGALNLVGSLTALGIKYSRLWSENFDDDFFNNGLSAWLEHGHFEHDLSHIIEQNQGASFFESPAGELGQYLGQSILRSKAIMGLFDSFCMGMINCVFPQQALSKIGMPMESFSQSALLHEMKQVPDSLREACLQYYLDRGMDFKFGVDDASELTRAQVLEQCAMMIAMARFSDEFGCAAIGVQYQQGLKDCCAASDFAEGAIGSTERFPIPDKNGKIISPDRPITCINEVDMGSGIPQIMLCKLLETLNLPSETTLHDVRWGSEYEGTFYWDFEISGNVPFEHLKGGIAGATAYRQPAMYFSKGGATIAGQCKKGSFVWSRAYYEGLDVHMHIGTGKAYELPEEEFQRRLNATTDVWPLMNVTLDGVSRDQLMAGHQSNHVTVAYVPEDHLLIVRDAFAAMCLTQNIKTHFVGQI